MSLRFLRREHVRESIAALAIAAYFLLALVPTGFMPSVDGPGWLRLCTARGTVTVPATGDTQSPAHGDAGADCAFALLASAVAPPPVSAQIVARLPLIAGTLLPASSPSAAATGLLRSQTSRGPPRSLTT